MIKVSLFNSIYKFLVVFALMLFMSSAFAASKDCLPMNGYATYNYAPDGKSGVASMSGDFAGGVHFKQTSDFKVDNSGTAHASFEHMFVTKNGSTIRTQDKSWGIVVKDTPYIVGGGAYTVVDATGTYEGYTGTFKSWGTFAPSLKKAVLRYEGELCRSDA